MPCVDPGDDGRFIGLQAKKIDMLTRLLCEACQMLDDKVDEVGTTHDPRSRELQNWWAAHKMADLKRKAAEAKEERRDKLRREALAKLTEEERQVLGLLGGGEEG